MRRVLFLLAPRWLALHVVVLAAAVTMVLLGQWQWRVAHVHHGSIQNYAYSFQWWAFAAFALLMWVRVMRDATYRRDATRVAAPEVTRGEPAPVAYRRYVMRTRPPDPSDDPELAAYNAYLAELNRTERTPDE